MPLLFKIQKTQITFSFILILKARKLDILNLCLLLFTTEKDKVQVLQQNEMLRLCSTVVGATTKN